MPVNVRESDPLDAATRGPEYSIGMDIGGTNVRAALYRGLDRERAERAARGSPDPAGAPHPVATHREPVGDDRDPRSIAARLGRIARELSPGDADRVPVGVGIAAMMRGFDGFVANSPHLGWRDVPFGTLLSQELLASSPLWLGNDVDAIAYGEYALGAGVGVNDVLVVYVGTGIGAGIVAGGRLFQGASNCAGELGHFKIAFGDSAHPCACGLRGCVETFIGGSYLTKRVRRDLARGIHTAAVRFAGGDPDAIHPGHLDLAAAEGDAYALELYAEIAPPFAVALGNALALLNPARLILGGGVLSRAPVLIHHVLTALELTATRATLDPVTVTNALLGDEAGLAGSALLATQVAADH